MPMDDNTVPQSAHHKKSISSVLQASEKQQTIFIAAKECLMVEQLPYSYFKECYKPQNLWLLKLRHKGFIPLQRGI